MITTAELFAELSAAMVHVPRPVGDDVPPRTYTGPELRSTLGWSPAAFTRNMTALLAAGEVTVVKIRCIAVDGRRATIAAYQFRASV